MSRWIADSVTNCSTAGAGVPSTVLSEATCLPGLVRLLATGTVQVVEEQKRARRGIGASLFEAPFAFRGRRRRRAVNFGPQRGDHFWVVSESARRTRGGAGGGGGGLFFFFFWGVRQTIANRALYAHFPRQERERVFGAGPHLLVQRSASLAAWGAAKPPAQAKGRRRSRTHRNGPTKS